MSILLKKNNLTLNGRSGNVFSGSRERRSKFEDSGCDIPAIYHHYNVDEPRLATETNVKTKNHNDMQRPVVERIKESIDGTTYMDSETNQRNLIE
jgi:hypothetical protein